MIMNNTLKLTITGILVGSLSLPLPLPKAVQAAEPTVTTRSSQSLLLAENHSEAVPDSKAPKTPKDKGQHAKGVKKHADEILGFTLQNTVNNGLPLETRQVKPNPLVLLEMLKNSLSELLQQHGKPLQVNTNIKMLVSDKMAKQLGELPTLTIKTNVDSQGKGQSELTIPEVRLVAKEGSLNWQGLTGQLMFPEKFDTLSVALKAAALTFEEADKSSLSISPMTLNGVLDADLLPTQGDFSLPALTMVEHKNEVNVKDVSLNFKTDQTNSGLQLGGGSFKIGQIGVIKQGTSMFMLEGLELVSDSKEQEGLVTATIHSRINQLAVNEIVVPDENLEMSYKGDLEFRRLDAQVALELQKTKRDMLKQLQAGTISEEMLGIVIVGKLIEMAPKLLAKSPEIALSQLSLKTKEGELRGEITISIDGKKVTALDFNHLLTGAQAQADFDISKALLEKMFATAQAGKHKRQKPKAGEKSPAQQIQALVDQKILVASGEDNYKLSATFQNGKLTLNGQERPVPFLSPEKHGEPQKGEPAGKKEEHRAITR
jgi:uncharacterized protein YdgA (DUF945 family)